VQATAYGWDDARCKVGSWTAASYTVQARIRCHNAAGSPADAYFTATYHNAEIGDTARDNGYVRADNPTASSYTPSAIYQMNSRGTQNTVQRTGVGAYTVTMPGFSGAHGGSVQVSAYGTGANHCKVNSWSSTAVNVNCYTAAGAAADTAFVLDRRDRTTLTGAGGGYAWADGISTTSWYTPSTGYQWSAGGTTVVAVRCMTAAGAPADSRFTITYAAT
jgi:hypothetical protein